MMETHPTCLAPSQTFAWPSPSPTTPVVSYTTFSPITRELCPWAGSFSVAVVVRVSPCLDLLFRPVTAPAWGWESGSSSRTFVPATVPLLALKRSTC
jgi:hypothetical protein